MCGERMIPLRDVYDYVHWAYCAKCGREALKKRMTGIYMKKGSYGKMALRCHVCDECLPELCDELGVEEV